jgi:hypothetical protein
MAGLASGSLYFGRQADRQGQPLKTYAWLEVGVGRYAAVEDLPKTDTEVWGDRLTEFASRFQCLEAGSMASEAQRVDGM